MKKQITFFTFCAILVALCFPAEAQQQAGKIPRIGVLTAASASSNQLIGGFQQGFRGLGYIEGQNIAIEYRYAEGKLDRLPALATELGEPQGRSHCNTEPTGGRCCLPSD
jgi:hypothetical protein